MKTNLTVTFLAIPTLLLGCCLIVPPAMAQETESCTVWQKIVDGFSTQYKAFDLGNFDPHLGGKQLNITLPGWEGCIYGPPSGNSGGFLRCTKVSSAYTDLAPIAQAVSQELHKCFPDAKFYRPADRGGFWGGSQDINLGPQGKMVIYWMQNSVYADFSND